MAFGRLERPRNPQPMSDINMTPLIDVMLVLLVIFMITAPLMTASLRLDLPKAEAATPSDAPSFIAVASAASSTKSKSHCTSVNVWEILSMLALASRSPRKKLGVGA